MLSVIVPIFNEEKHIARCIDSILSQDYPKDDLEVLLLDGMSTDRTRDIINQYAEEYPFIHLMDNPGHTAPSAMNIGIRASHGEVIIRLDAHAIFPGNYISELVVKLRELNADNVGGVCQTLPLRDTVVCNSIASVLSSSFGMGNSYFRVGADHVMQVDTVPFGCFRRELFDRIGFFDETLVRNQDDEFNGRIVKNGGKIYLLPYLVVKYYARDTMAKVFSMFYQYGLYKPLVNKRLGSPATIRQFFPPLFVAGLAIGGIFSLFSQWIRLLYISVLLFYLLLATCFSVKCSRNPLRILVQDFTYLVVHCGYGLGYISGLFHQLLGIPYKTKANR